MGISFVYLCNDSCLQWVSIIFHFGWFKDDINIAK